MRTQLLLTLFVTIFPLIISARTLRGSITDSSGEAVAYASIAIYNDSTFILPVTADSCGVFAARLESVSHPRLRVSMIGYETVDTLIYNPLNNISIVLKNSNIALKEIEVRHAPPMISMKGDMLVTNVSGSALKNVGSAKDVLRYVPLISIGSNDDIEVFGRGAPAIYINGRKVTDLRELNQLRSENIKSVDVITNPGARYSADIMAVVKIRTVKPRGEGFSVATGLSETYDDHFSNAGDLSIKYRKNSLEVFAEGSYSLGKHGYRTGNDQWSTDVQGTVLRQDAISDRIADMKWGAIKTGLSYAFTPDHSVGAFYNYGYWRKYETLHNVQDITVDRLFSGRWITDGIDTTLSAPSHNINFYYSGEVSNLAIDLNADYVERDNTHNFFFDELNALGDSEDFKNHNEIYIQNANKSRMFAEKLILDYRVGATSIELGEEYTQSQLNSLSLNVGTPFEGAKTKVTERNFATFAEVHQSWRDFRAGIGMRYEYTVNEFEVRGADNRERRVDYSNVFPSASISWSHNDANLSLSFTNKSIRPSYSQLSDILQYSTSSKYWRGNPELKSERFYNFQLSASWKNFFGQVIYTHTRDAIFQTYEPYEDSPNVSLITYRNIPTLNTVSSSLGIRHKVSFWSPTVTLSIAKQWHHIATADGRKGLSDPIGRVRYDNIFNLPDDWTAMVSFDFTSGGDSHNQGNKSRNSLDASISKTLFGGDMVVRADATDLLNRSYLRYSIYNEVGKISCLDTWPNRSVRLSIRYSFNTAASHYKGRGAGITEKSRL